MSREKWLHKKRIVKFKWDENGNKVGAYEIEEVKKTSPEPELPPVPDLPDVREAFRLSDENSKRLAKEGLERQVLADSNTFQAMIPQIHREIHVAIEQGRQSHTIYPPGDFGGFSKGVIEHLRKYMLSMGYGFEVQRPDSYSTQGPSINISWGYNELPKAKPKREEKGSNDFSFVPESAKKDMKKERKSSEDKGFFGNFGWS